jgi:hypothetical protein
MAKILHSNTAVLHMDRMILLASSKDLSNEFRLRRDGELDYGVAATTTWASISEAAIGKAGERLCRRFVTRS